jgi:hypothetical protein
MDKGKTALYNWVVFLMETSKICLASLHDFLNMDLSTAYIKLLMCQKFYDIL